MTEIRVLDTYWSDHCRHTTFSTELTEVSFGDGDYRKPMEDTYKEYLQTHSEIFKGREDKFVCLMDLALMAMRKLKKEGKLQDQEESDEINACSIVVPVEVDGVEEEWLVNFKNETHNHPTEIEPFGGAATCLGGAIRDPLSGRTYVYQAMRVTGAADPTVSVKETMKGKLPQKKLVRSAAHGYSSYGNQIGLATGLVKEIYHPDYVAKRMEIGAVMGAAPRRAVIRENSDPGDIIILLGGRTGRDGCGGATGSSKVHTEESIETCGAEVQKGNAPTERKIQRMFRREEVSKLIKKCNDFGAGGVSVAIGELADGLQINLDKVPKKYAGLDGTEIAISESQERMAVVVDPKDVDEFLGYAKEENLEAVKVAVVTEDPRLVLSWRGKEIVNISRAFLNTNGAHQETTVKVDIPSREDTILKKQVEVGDVKEKWLDTLKDLNVCSQKGLVEMFDGSIGAGSVFMPHGGKYQMTETQSMVAIVTGGGNFWRGRTSETIDRTKADQIGMLATVMNCIYVSDIFRHVGMKTEVFTPFVCGAFTSLFSKDAAVEALNEGKVIFFAGGTGHPYFSTDTGAVLRAIEIEADAMLLAKAIDGIYDSDPKVNPEAKKYDEISIQEIIDKKLMAVDLTASIMYLENKMPMLVFGLNEENSIVETMSGNFNGTKVTV